MSRDGAGRGPVARSRPSPCRDLAQKDEHERRVERLRAELEAERRRAQELRRNFATETRQLKEAAERDRQLLAEQLHSQWQQRQARELQRLRELNRRQREVEIRELLRCKEVELQEAQRMLQQQRDTAICHARDLQKQLVKQLLRGARNSSEGPAKLLDVLMELRWESNAEQAAEILRLQDEQLLQRRLFLKYILERFEGEQPASCQETRDKATSWHCLQWKSREGLEDACLQEEGNSVEDLGQDSALTMAARTPAAPQDTKSLLVGEPEGEASTALCIPTVCEGGENMALAKSGDHQGEASTAIVSPAAHKDEVACLSPAQPLAHSSPSPAGIATLPHTRARRQRWLSLFRRACRAFCCTCPMEQQEHWAGPEGCGTGRHARDGCMDGTSGIQLP